MKVRLLTSLANRLTLGFTLLACILVAIMLVTLHHSLNRFTEDTIQQGKQQLTEALRAQLEQDAQLLSRTLSSHLSIPLYHLDLSAIEKQLSLVRQHRSLEYAYLFSREGRLIHDGSETIPEFGLAMKSLTPLSPESDLHYAWHGQTLHLLQPVMTSSQRSGYLALGVDFTRALTALDRHGEVIGASAKATSERTFNELFLIAILVLAITVWLLYRFCRHQFAPLQELTQKSIAFGEGDRSVRFGVAQSGELGLLGNALERMRLSLEQSHHQTTQLAYLDNLTQLPNRHWFQQSLERLLELSRQNQQRMGVVFIDLDHFKEVNDTAGHDMGDLLLFEAAARLRNLLMEMDISAPDTEEPLLARLGGDEFVTLYPDLQHTEQLSELARRIAQTLDEPFLIDGRYFNISSSIGITIYPDDGNSSSEILKHADIAMYAAKQSGRNQYAFFSMQMNHQLQQRIETIQGVRTALDQGHFHLEYQPVVDLSTNRIRAAEALLRWNHPERGLIPPGLFIPVIEDSDLIEPVTQWVAQQAVRDLMTLQALKPGFAISINISGAALHQESTRDFLTDLKQREQVPDYCLSIELTETSMIRHLDDCRQTLKQWKDAGMNIWIDDFGTGYSSLSYLHQLPIDGLKIDRSFTRDLKPDSSNSLVATVLTLAESMQLQVVAEGIETDSQLECYRRLGSRYGQGFGLYRPMPYNDLKALLETTDEVHTATS
ncbi:putative bifunctional diguanylate cyclase/phosphodiesterase [Marinobacterium stanieri]|uniref:putative bifunctional diguanylate cyclase/phosphodiesterase n=1 Tax=Marinobacterium stanieri TaxID=49186 RepID=UPI0002558C0A|nr:EAL domain-containing protein [Marinobacterium stanieri]